MKIEWLIADKLAVGSSVVAESAVFWVMLIFFSKFVPLLRPGDRAALWSGDTFLSP